MELGEWQQYCSNVLEDIPRANHLLSRDYVVPGCTMRSLVPEKVIESMILEGGWSLIGDSLTREVAIQLKSDNIYYSIYTRYSVNYHLI
jgi:hypothetical protein